MCIFISSIYIRIQAEVHYNSEYYKKELEKYQPTQSTIFSFKTEKYEVDPTSKRVTIKYHKKFKFESLNPFKITEKFHRGDVYLLLTHL